MAKHTQTIFFRYFFFWMQEHPSSTLSFKIKQEIVQIVESQKYSEAGFMILEAFVFPLLHSVTFICLRSQKRCYFRTVLGDHC